MFGSPYCLKKLYSNLAGEMFLFVQQTLHELFLKKMLLHARGSIDNSAKIIL